MLPKQSIVFKTKTEFFFFAEQIFFGHIMHGTKQVLNFFKLILSANMLLVLNLFGMLFFKRNGYQRGFFNLID